MIVDDQQGFKIWIGSDGQRFGCVMEENMLRESMHMLFIMNDVSTNESTYRLNGILWNTTVTTLTHQCECTQIRSGFNFFFFCIVCG